MQQTVEKRVYLTPTELAEEHFTKYRGHYMILGKEESLVEACKLYRHVNSTEMREFVNQILTLIRKNIES